MVVPEIERIVSLLSSVSPRNVLKRLLSRVAGSLTVTVTLALSTPFVALKYTSAVPAESPFKTRPASVDSNFATASLEETPTTLGSVAFAGVMR